MNSALGIILGGLLLVVGVTQVVLARRIALFMSRRNVGALGELGRRAAAGQTRTVYRVTGIGLALMGAFVLLVSAI